MAALGPLEERREVLLDRTQHTRLCSSCRGASRNIKIMQGALSYLALAGVLLLTSLNLNSPLMPAALVRYGRAVSPLLAPACFLAAVGAGVLRVLHRRWFVFQDYVHAHHK
jgi:hypothetical protein